jgi:hypothetical protein
LIDAGTTEIAATPGVLGWLDPTLDALVSPMQPEQERIVKSRSQRPAEGRALSPTNFVSSTDSRAPPSIFID